jgi:predicted nuclease with TOPRIM domain
LEGASDEQIQRIVDRNGGVIPSLRQFSKDLAESNGRVAEERNKKLELVEKTRNLRDENDHLMAQLEEMQRKYKNVQNLFKRFVRPEMPGQIQIVDSPNGHYILGEFAYCLRDITKRTIRQKLSPCSAIWSYTDR